MNAPFAILTQARPAPIEEVFRARCDALAVLHVNDQIALCDAVDQLQAFAEQSGLVDAVGQDMTQDILAAAFCAVDFALDDEAEADEAELFGDAAAIVRRWELADPRDRWQHVGEAPPPDRVRNSAIGARLAITATRHRTPQATRDAFQYVAHQGDLAHLKAWLRDHRRDAPYLLDMLESQDHAD